MANLDMYLNKLRWDTVYEKFTEMNAFSTDGIEYKFKHPLTNKEQIALIDFMGDAKTMNSRTPVDFCNFLIQHRIEFMVNFRYSCKLPVKRNWKCYKIVKMLRKELERLYPTKWHRIYDETDLPKDACYYLIQTTKDFEQNICQQVTFDTNKKMFISMIDKNPVQDVLCWKNIPKERLRCKTT